MNLLSPKSQSRSSSQVRLNLLLLGLGVDTGGGRCDGGRLAVYSKSALLRVAALPSMEIPTFCSEHLNRLFSGEYLHGEAVHG